MITVAFAGCVSALLFVLGINTPSINDSRMYRELAIDKILGDANQTITDTWVPRADNEKVVAQSDALLNVTGQVRPERGGGRWRRRRGRGRAM